MKGKSIKRIALVIMIVMVSVNILINAFFYLYLKESNERLLLEKCENIADNIYYELNQSLDMMYQYSSRLYSELYRLEYFHYDDSKDLYNRQRELYEVIDLLNEFMDVPVHSLLINYKNNTMENYSRILRQEDEEFLLAEYENMKKERDGIVNSASYCALDRGDEIWLLELRICKEYDFSEIRNVELGSMLSVIIIDKQDFYEKYELPQSLSISISKIVEGQETEDIRKEDTTSVVSVSKAMRIGMEFMPDYMLVCVLQNKKELSNFESMQFLILVQIGLNIAMMGIWTIVLGNYITSPLRRIVRHMITAAAESERRMPEDFVCSEMNVVASCYNELIDNLREKNRMTFYTQQRLYEMELCEKEREMKALQSQINPHFIYNMLENIRVLAETGSMEKVSEVAIRTADFLRYSLYISGFVSLADELAATMSYLEIMKICYEDMFRVEYFVDEQLESMQVPKMILQPLIGNIFKHGFTFDNNENIIRLEMKQEDNTVFISVFDNGRGIEAEKLDKLNNELNVDVLLERDKGFGLYSINRRIRTIYGNGYGIRVESQADEYTEVILSLPV